MERMALWVATNLKTVQYHDAAHVTQREEARFKSLLKNLLHSMFFTIKLKGRSYHLRLEGRKKWQILDKVRPSISLIMAVKFQNLRFIKTTQKSCYPLTALRTWEFSQLWVCIQRKFMTTAHDAENLMDHPGDCWLIVNDGKCRRALRAELGKKV